MAIQTKVAAIGVRGLSNFTHGQEYELEESIPALNLGAHHIRAAYIVIDNHGKRAYVHAHRFELI